MEQRDSEGRGEYYEDIFKMDIFQFHYKIFTPDVEEFHQHTECLVSQYQNMTLLGKHVNGR